MRICAVSSKGVSVSSTSATSTSTRSVRRTSSSRPRPTTSRRCSTSTCASSRRAFTSPNSSTTRIESSRRASRPPATTCRRRRPTTVQIGLVSDSLDRLNEVIGGARYEGEAVESGIVKQVDFALIGPYAIYSTKDEAEAGTRRHPAELGGALPVPDRGSDAGGRRQLDRAPRFGHLPVRPDPGRRAPGGRHRGHADRAHPKGWPGHGPDPRRWRRRRCSWRSSSSSSSRRFRVRIARRSRSCSKR